MIPTASTSPRFRIEIGSRAYPFQVRERPAREHEPNDTAAAPETRNHLYESIWASMPFRDSECVDSKSLFDSYSDSIQLLEQMHAELEAMLRIACRTNFYASSAGDDRSGDFDAQVEREIVKIIKSAELRPMGIEGTVSAKLATKPNEEIQNQLGRSLRKSVSELVTKTFQALERLTGRNVVGVIEWESATTCRFHFFRDFFHQKFGKTWEQHRSKKRGVNVDGRYAKERTTTTSRHQRGQTTRYRQRIEHHLIDAKTHAVSDPDVEIPRPYRELASSIPGWLRPVACLVSGGLIREDIIEQYRVKKEWQKEEIVSRKVDLHYDPAIVIGDFVLTGWGQKEIEHEAVDRESTAELLRFEEKSNQRKLEIACYALASGGLQLAGIWSTLNATSANSLGFSLIVALASLFPLFVAAERWQLDKKRKLTRQDKNDVAMIVAAVGVGSLSAHAIIAAFALRNLPILLIGVASASLFYAARPAARRLGLLKGSDRD